MVQQERFVRPPAVAEAFYPARTSNLKRMLAQFLEVAATQVNPEDPAPKAVLVPHAGYVYSGSTAALAYARIAEHRDQINRVVLVGPAHRLAFRGIALPGWTAFSTPLGEVEVHQPSVALARWLPYVVELPEAHKLEHCLEVQLPFLQTVLGDFEIVPLVVGQATATNVAVALEEFWDGPETLVVISSDLSHYLPYSTAQTTDAETVRRILALEPTLEHDRACGATPVNGMIVEARKHGLRPRLLGNCNSGDTAGGKDRVVGYTAISFEDSGVGSL